MGRQLRPARFRRQPWLLRQEGQCPPAACVSPLPDAREGATPPRSGKWAHASRRANRHPLHGVMESASLGSGPTMPTCGTDGRRGCDALLARSHRDQGPPIFCNRLYNAAPAPCRMQAERPHIGRIRATVLPARKRWDRPSGDGAEHGLMSRKTSQNVGKATSTAPARKTRSAPKASATKARTAGSRTRAAPGRKAAPPTAIDAAGRPSLWLELGDYALGLALLAAGIWILVRFLGTF